MNDAVFDDSVEAADKDTRQEATGMVQVQEDEDREQGLTVWKEEIESGECSRAEVAA